MTPPALRSAKRRAAREALMLRAKQGAALLKQEAQMQRNALSVDAEEFVPTGVLQADAESLTLAPESCGYEVAAPSFVGDVDGEQTTDMAQASISEDSSSESSAADGRRCRFGGTALETVPATPVGAVGVGSLASPPGLSRAAMRQARDAYKAGAVATSSWGDCPASTQSTDTLSTKPMTPLALRSMKRRTVRDALLARAR